MSEANEYSWRQFRRLRAAFLLGAAYRAQPVFVPLPQPLDSPRKRLLKNVRPRLGEMILARSKSAEAGLDTPLRGA
jgi:hypothetical protein